MAILRRKEIVIHRAYVWAALLVLLCLYLEFRQDFEARASHKLRAASRKDQLRFCTLENAGLFCGRAQFYMHEEILLPTGPQYSQRV